MRISRRRRKPEEPKKVFVYNESIRAPQVLVLNNEGKKIGIMDTSKALQSAREQEMDLVEINPKNNPPVARIMNFGQYQYSQEKAARLKKAHQTVIKIKGIRLSLRIGAHDMDIRKKRTLEFLNSGNKIKIDVILKGRELQHIPLAFDLLKKFIAEIETTCQIKFDQEYERQGRMVTAIISKA